MKYTEIIEKTYEIIDEIKKNEIYQNYHKYKNLIDTDEELGELLKKFNSAKEKFSENYRFRAYDKSFDKVKNVYQEAKINLMNNKLFKNYKLYEKKVETYLNEIELRLKEVVNIKEKSCKNI